jgi:DNA-binding CsgD family transcriptional regulator
MSYNPDSGITSSDWIASTGVDARITDVLDVRGVSELKDAVVQFATKLDFESVSAMLVIDKAGGPSEFVTVDNVSDRYRTLFNDPSRFVNPVMGHCKLHGTPIVWDRETYVRGKATDIWEAQAPYGVRCGIAFALHLPRNLHFFLGVSRWDDLPARVEHVTQLVAELQLFTTYASEAAIPILKPRPRGPRPLTDREIEVLNWTSNGKTAWEVGRLLGISERTSVKHLQSAMSKLDCSTKLRAVVKALELGLLS